MSSDQSPPYSGSYWVIPGTLLAGEFPGGSDETLLDERLGALLDAGIHSVINLLPEEEELDHEDGIHYVPYEDRLEQLGEARGLIDGRNSPTLVHCSNGAGRTGMVIGCYLARHGIAKGKAGLERIRDLRAACDDLAGTKSPESMVEEKFVLRWKTDQ